MWVDLAKPWQACLEEAWAAICLGSKPIGAVVVDVAGKILSRGRNHLHDDAIEPGEIGQNHLAHAELNALLKVANLNKSVLHQSTLYTLLQPCPLCFGALYMSGVRELRYAARDGYAGSDNLLGKTPYLSIKPIRVIPPQDTELEEMVIAIFVADTLATTISRPDAVVEAERKIQPKAAEFGEFLFQENWLSKMAKDQFTAKAMYDNLRYLFTAIIPITQ
jgi:tRNA(adenine34) deaminase